MTQPYWWKINSVVVGISEFKLVSILVVWSAVFRRVCRLEKKCLRSKSKLVHLIRRHALVNRTSIASLRTLTNIFPQLYLNLCSQKSTFCYHPQDCVLKCVIPPTIGLCWDQCNSVAMDRVGAMLVHHVQLVYLTCLRYNPLTDVYLKKQKKLCYFQ